MPTSPNTILSSSDDLVNATPRAPVRLPDLQRVCGVDFSGAAQSGKTAWLAVFEAGEIRRPLRLTSLSPIGRLAGTDRREEVCQFLVQEIASSQGTLWAMDFPFALPLELGGNSWAGQLRRIEDFQAPSNARNVAAEFGRRLAREASHIHVPGRIRRRTDVETSTPFDSYHYRIIYQTFHGMRDVLHPLAAANATAILPFQYEKLGSAQQVVVESCPASFLKRWNLPAARYKQTAGRSPDRIHRQTRQKILRNLRTRSSASHDHRENEEKCPGIFLSDYRRRQIMQDSGGDALDAVLAGVSGWDAIHRVDHDKIAVDSRYPLEGFVYA